MPSVPTQIFPVAVMLTEFCSEAKAAPTIKYTKDSVLGYKTPKLLRWVDLGRPQVPTKLLYHFPFSTGQAEEKATKRLWVTIRTGISLTSHHHVQNRLSLGKMMYCQLIRVS